MQVLYFVRLCNVDDVADTLVLRIEPRRSTVMTSLNTLIDKLVKKLQGYEISKCLHLSMMFPRYTSWLGRTTGNSLSHVRMNQAESLETCHHDNQISDKRENQWSPPLKAHELKCQHGKDSESHKVRCYDQHCIPPELKLVTKVVTKEVANHCVVAIKTFHVVIPVAKLADSKTIQDPG